MSLDNVLAQHYRRLLDAQTDPTPAEVLPRVGVPASSFLRFSSLDEFLNHRRHAADELADQRAFEASVSAALPGAPLLFFSSIHGGFVPMDVRGAGTPVDWRETAHCPASQLNTRTRFCLDLIASRLTGCATPRVYLTEQATFGYAAARKLFPGVVGSEFVYDQARKQALQNYIRELCAAPDEILNSEDVTALSFADGSFDVVGSFEVLEHVPDYRQALVEMARVLRPGGALVLTAPFLDQSANTVVRARLTPDGAVEHLLPAEYHGDPVSADGALCFYHFGWDLLDALRAAGLFESAEVVTGWAPEFGILGDNISAFVARKGS